MQLIPTEQEVIDLLKQTGALRYGHFEYPNGLHSDQRIHRHRAPAARRPSNRCDSNGSVTRASWGCSRQPLPS